MKADLDSIDLFTRVVRAGSFSAAARAAGVSPSAISKRIARLEEQLGVALLHRTTRKLALTGAGENFYDVCSRGLREIERAQDTLSNVRDSPSGLVRVRVPQAFGHKFVTPFIPGFVQEYPMIELDIIYCSLSGDHIDEKIYVLIASADPCDVNLAVRTLAPIERVTCAARSYIERFGAPEHFAGLSFHNCLMFSGSDSNDREWVLHLANGPQRIRVSGTFRTNNAEAIYAAVLAGIGIAHMPAFIAEPGLASGELIPLFRDQAGYAGATMKVYFPQAKLRLPKVAVFLDHLMRAFQRNELGHANL